MDSIDGNYVITNPISDENLRQMKENMDDTDAENFEKFIEKHWKKTVNKEKEAVEAVSEIKPKRTRKKTETVEEPVKKRGRKTKTDKEQI